ncbi:MAG: ferredoxin family protein [Methanobacteriota archaeon]
MEKHLDCGACVNICPVHPKVLELRESDGEGSKAFVARPDACDALKGCARVCPTGAVSFTLD